VVQWEEFAKDVVGKQMARATDSIGANIAESYGRFNFGEKLQFLYYSRGSLFEAKFWLNRALARDLMKADEVKTYAARSVRCRAPVEHLCQQSESPTKGRQTSIEISP
jgi:four helix bundle protein